MTTQNKKQLRGRRKGVKAYAVGDKEGLFVVPGECERGDIEPLAIFQSKADARDFARDFKDWHNKVIIHPIFRLPL